MTKLLKNLDEKLLIYKQNKDNRKFVFKNSDIIYPLAYFITKKLIKEHGKDGNRGRVSLTRKCQDKRCKECSFVCTANTGCYRYCDCRETRKQLRHRKGGRLPPARR